MGDLLPKAIIINGDGSHHDLLLEEGLRSIDAFVSLTGIDEENILTSLFAKEMGVSGIITKVNSDELTRMGEKLGLDSVVSAKNITADIIIRYARALENSQGSNIETLYKLMNGNAEAIEFNARRGSELIGMSIKNLKIKSGILIAGIISQRNTAVIPTGESTIEEGDRVIVLASAAHRLRDLSDILSR